MDEADKEYMLEYIKLVKEKNAIEDEVKELQLKIARLSQPIDVKYNLLVSRGIIK